MADRKQMELSKLDRVYSWLCYELQKTKAELLKEMKYSSVQMGALYSEMKSDKDKSAQAISQEIRYSYKQNQTIYDGLANLLTEEVGQRLNAMDEKISSLEEIKAAVADAVAKLEATQVAVDQIERIDPVALADSVKENIVGVIPQLEEAVNEIKYSFMQHQAIYDGLTALITGEVVAKLGDVESKLAMMEEITKELEEIHLKVVEGINAFEDADYKSVIESVTEKTEESVAEHSRQILDAVSAIPVAENVDYHRIVEEVGDKVLELLGDVIAQDSAPVEKQPAEPVEAKIDYDKIIYGAAEKVVESLPYPEKVDYRRIDEHFTKAAEKVQVNVQADVITAAVNAAVAQAIAAFDFDKLAAAVAEKVQIPAVETPEIDYELLSDMVATKLAANNEQSYDVVLDETGIEQIAQKVSERIDATQTVAAEVDYERIAATIDYERIAAIVEEKSAKEPVDATYELVLDDEGIQSIADCVAQRLCETCADCTVVPAEEETPVVEETAQEVVEEPVQETVEELVEEPQVEETVEEVAVEETPVVEEIAPVSEELAVAEEPSYDELNDQLVDAETGLVIRLKKSFTAKMKQSEDRVKGYYSDIKNELTSFKRVNSNVSWHGDRFNFGRDTVAKMNICGKTLCFYLALDPEDPELKTTVYHQKNVGGQRAYESTPFMMKIKSDAAAKKALRLVAYLAEKIGAKKEENFEAVDYVEEFAYASTKQLFDDGFIKVTKEKKVELDF